MDALIPIITNVGLQRTINADNDGVEARISHIAFGDAGGNANRYDATRQQTELVRERARVAIGGGERINSFEIAVEALLDTGPTFNINEIGFVLDDGTFLAIWASSEFSLAVKTAGIPLAVVYNLALSGIPPGSVNINISGPNVNISIVGPIASTAASFMRTWRRMVQSDIDQFLPIITNKWR